VSDESLRFVSIESHVEFTRHPDIRKFLNELERRININLMKACLELEINGEVTITHEDLVRDDGGDKGAN
jgi:hypothetical protein